MKRLKIILQSNGIFFLFLFVTILVTFLKFQMPLYQESKLGNQKIAGVIKNIKVGTYYTQLTVGDTLVAVTEGEYQLGETVSCSGEVSIPTSQRNFYLFDYQKYLASKRIYYEMEGNCVITSTKISLWYQIKNKIVGVIQKRKSHAYLKAFLLGDTSEIEDSIFTSYQKNGISHLFSISGMHISFFFLLFQIFIKDDRKRNWFLFFFFLFYLFLTNYSPSVMRASLFFFFSNYLEKRGISKIKAFLYFTMFFILYQPYYLYHTGFLYSFSISFYLLFFSSFLRTGSFFKQLGKISFFSFVASLPIQIQTNFSLNFFSVFYNLFFVPIVSNFYFPFSFCAFFFSIFDSFYFFTLSILENVSSILSHIPSSIIFCHLPWIGILIYYVVITFFLYQISKKEYKYSVVLLLLFLIHKGLPYCNPYGMILMLDIGQGDSFLIVYPHQKLTILVDTGGTFYDSTIAENTLLPTLYAHGISSLDYLVITHGDTDHIGEALDLVKLIPVQTVFLNSGALTDEETSLLTYLEEKNISFFQVSKESFSIKGETLTFLNSKKSESENEDSLVLLLKIKGYSILFMGDSGEVSEQELLQEYNLSEVDILKVGHHGSKYSSSASFIEEVNPKICLISAGVDNRYGHPHQETLNRLQSCDTYITSIDGATKVILGKSMRVTSVR